jgi:hypothetical protein
VGLVGLVARVAVLVGVTWAFIDRLSWLYFWRMLPPNVPPAADADY